MSPPGGLLRKPRSSRAPRATPRLRARWRPPRQRIGQGRAGPCAALAYSLTWWSPASAKPRSGARCAGATRLSQKAAWWRHDVRRGGPSWTALFCMCDHSGAHMKVVTVRDFRDHATEMFRSEDVILVTRDGAPAGFYLPWDTPELPVEVRREVFLRLSEQIGAK